MSGLHGLLKLQKYAVAQDAGIVKLNQNESPYDVPAALKRKIVRRLQRACWNRYPPQSPAGLINAIARYAGVDRAGIVIGNSSNEIIQAVIQAACVRGDRLVTVSPGFAIYPRVGRILGLDVREVPLDEDYEFDVDRIADSARGAQLVMLASPNSPTGTALGTKGIERLLRNARCLVAVDEAYYEFCRKTCVGLMPKYGNLMIIRTMSKAFSLAGARLGYLIARPEVAEAVESVRLPFSVGWFGQVAGMEALRNSRYVKAHAERTRIERDRVFGKLQALKGIRPVPSKTNFILFELKGVRARVVFSRLYERGVLVRPYDTGRLARCLRVTIGRRQENDAFLNALRAVMEAA